MNSELITEYARYYICKNRLINPNFSLNDDDQLSILEKQLEIETNMQKVCR